MNTDTDFPKCLEVVANRFVTCLGDECATDMATNMTMTADAGMTVFGEMQTRDANAGDVLYVDQHKFKAAEPRCKRENRIEPTSS
jgi:hypothetical protein